MPEKRHPVDTPARANKLLYQMLQVLDLKGLSEEITVDIGSFLAWYRKPGPIGAHVKERFETFRANREYLIEWEDGRTSVVIKGESALLVFLHWSKATLRQMMSNHRGILRHGKGAEKCTITRLDPPSE